MKTYKYIFALVATALVLNACSDNWLNQEPQGSSITEKQFKERKDMIQGSVYGAYAMMYQYGGDHDVFGFRSIDMYGDLNCGDMAMKSWSYGWFQDDEKGQTYQRRAYLWSYYYDIIRQCNKTIVYIKQDSLIDFSRVDNDKYVEENAETFYYYAEVLAMRGWAYANLQKWFCPTPSQLATEGKTLETKMSLPIYTEEVVEADTILGAPLSSAGDVYRRVEEDLSAAIRYMRLAEGAGMYRSLKHEINSDVARLILAYSYLNKEDWTNAFKWAKDFIDNTSAPVLSYDKVLTTGFAAIDETNWLWGQDVNIQTSTSLASFFGQVDVFSYSYAWAGDVKGIDANLYNSIVNDHAWDIRANWFNNLYNALGKYQYAPDGKFYSPSVKNANNYKSLPTAGDLDRNWVCDQVYMRAELGYLIAAEAACRNHEILTAVGYLTDITTERVKDDALSTAAYALWVASLMDEETLLEEIKYNWRVELWGEGYAMQTFRRFGDPVTLGENHKTRAKVTMNPNDETLSRKLTFEIPSGEQYYNPYLRSTTTFIQKR